MMTHQYSSQNFRDSVAVLFHRIGPYHQARLKALGSYCNLTAIECTAVDNTYAWAPVNSYEDFKKITLFTDVDIDEKSPAEIRRVLWPSLTNCEAQVVAIPGWGSKAALLALAWCLQNQVPAVVMSESQVIDERRIFWKEWIKSRVVKQYGAAQVGGSPHAKYLVKLGLPSEKIFNGYDVVDNDYFANGAALARSNADWLRTQKSLPERFFLNISRFVTKKNIAGLIDAYAYYLSVSGDNAWHLVILGDGPLKAQIEEQIARLGLQSRVSLPGFKQYDELPIYYGLASVYIQASTQEQWGLVVNEAMASGLPVLVANFCGCAPDLVRNDYNGFIFNPFDVSQLSDLMVKISGANFDLKGMGQASQRIIQDWSPETFAQSMVRAAKIAHSSPMPKFSLLDSLILRAIISK